jgi:hypothetical protein
MMSFREKSAWAMAVVTAGAGLLYLALFLGSFGEAAASVPLASLIGFVLFMVVASIIVQTALALRTPKEANLPADERERPQIDRAGNWSGNVLAVGVVVSLLHFLEHGDGTRLFHMTMASLIVAQVAEYGFQIAFFRRGA